MTYSNDFVKVRDSVASETYLDGGGVDGAIQFVQFQFFE